jgi:hypothetical protein
MAYLGQSSRKEWVAGRLGIDKAVPNQGRLHAWLPKQEKMRTKIKPLAQWRQTFCCSVNPYPTTGMQVGNPKYICLHSRQSDIKKCLLERGPIVLSQYMSGKVSIKQQGAEFWICQTP